MSLFISNAHAAASGAPEGDFNAVVVYAGGIWRYFLFSSLSASGQAYERTQKFNEFNCQK